MNGPWWIYISFFLALSKKGYASYDPNTMLQLVNQVRAQNGVNPLVLNTLLNQLAQNHAIDQFNMKKMDHMGSDGSSPGDRAKAAGYNYSKYDENVAEGFSNDNDVFNGWMNSAPHRENMLDPSVKEMGYGAQGGYYCQEFGALIGGVTSPYDITSSQDQTSANVAAAAPVVTSSNSQTTPEVVTVTDPSSTYNPQVQSPTDTSYGYGSPQVLTYDNINSMPNNMVADTMAQGSDGELYLLVCDGYVVQ